MNTPEIRAAKQDIAEVLVNYSTGIDRRDWTLFRSIFTVDVVAEYDDIATWNGVDEITDFMESAHAGMGHTLHRLTNIAIDVDIDAGTAMSRTYVDANLMMPDGLTGFRAVGYYDDRLVHSDEGWRIAHRHFVGVQREDIGAQ